MRAVNLIPSESRSGGSSAGRSGGGAYAVLALLGGLAVLALLYGIAHHQISSRRAQAASLTARAASAQAQAAQLAPYTSFSAMRQQRAQAVSELVDARFDWAHAFHELGRVLPRDATITLLDGSIGAGAEPSSGTAKPGASASAGGAPASSTQGTPATATASAGTATSATPPGSVPTFTLSGCATSQQEVALTLQRLRLIDGVSEVALQNSSKAAAGTGSSGGCHASDPAYTVKVTFAPLPSSATISSATKLTSHNGAGR
jgi:Tfp pilus assembly protein PilN